MLKAINTKLLLAIPAALTVIAGLLVQQKHVSEEAAASAAKAAAILQQQQKATDDQKKHDAEFWKGVEQRKKKSDADAGEGSKTNSYLP